MKIKEFFFTAFYSGYSPIAPGTMGTLVAMVIYIIENLICSGIDPIKLNIFNLIFLLIILYPSIKLADSAEKFFKTKDPQEVVIDEVLGYWTGVLFIPFSFSYAVMAFILFRLFDITKPFPVRSFESLPGGLGIIMDDIAAGIYTLASMHIIIYFLNQYNIVFP
ncbi:MAG: phosphatidylglycerophosphatase A [Leptospirales bacterium]|nr:phosphatidylglycerophosphatase A [Leptospirales bacterium]